MKSILKYPGSKWRIAKWIIEKMPQHHSYLEPYFGSGAVFFNKTPSNIETINDIDSDVINLFNVIRENSDELLKKITMTPYSREEYNNAFIEVAVELIKRFNSEKVLIYADPPYLTSTRKRNIYKYEMIDQEHEELLKVLLKHKGPVIISGYDNEMYNEYLKTWEKYQINNLAEHGIKRVETLWIKGAEIL